MSEEEKVEILKNKFLKYHLEYKDEEMLFEIIEKLQKENKKYIDVFNSTEKIMNGQERTKDKLLKENVELQKENEQLKDNQLWSEATIDGLKEKFISKDIIRNKIKELEEEQKRKRHTPNFIGCANTTNYVNINNKREIKVLKELLGE